MKTERNVSQMQKWPTKERKRKAGVEGKAKSHLFQLSYEDHFISQSDFLRSGTPTASSPPYNLVLKVLSPMLSYKECPLVTLWGEDDICLIKKKKRGRLKKNGTLFCVPWMMCNDLRWQMDTSTYD